MTFTLVFKVTAPPASGYIINNAQLYYMPKDGSFEEPGDEDESLVVEVEKIASPKTFKANGDDITYTISFDLPLDLSGYEAIRIEDVIPAGLALKGTNGTLDIGGATRTVTLATTASPDTAGFTLTGADITAAQGVTVSLTLTCTITGWTTGDITNEANIYFTPNGGGEEPGGSGDETVYQVDSPEGLLKVAGDGSKIKAGENITYTVSFDMPADVSKYDYITVVDTFPAAVLEF